MEHSAPDTPSWPKDLEEVPLLTVSLGQVRQGTAHTLESSGCFFGPDTNSCCCRPGLDTVDLVPASLLCCLRMAKTKAKQTREPVLKKNWRPMNLGGKQGTLGLRSPRSRARMSSGGGRVESADTTHGATRDPETGEVGH